VASLLLLDRTRKIHSVGDLAFPVLEKSENCDTLDKCWPLTLHKSPVWVVYLWLLAVGLGEECCLRRVEWALSV